MKSRSNFLLFALVAVFVTAFPHPNRAQEVEYSYFYDNLSPYGDWVDVEGYGFCFHPTGVPPDWRPYTDGHWVYTDVGWTWVSNEDFGSITTHYGRWVHLMDFGWVWRPGTEWGPAWVSWRKTDDCVGWAPLPPEAVYDPAVGIGIAVDVNYDIGPTFYSFCEFRRFGDPVLRDVILPPEQNVTLIGQSTNITNITTVNYNNTTVVYNGGPSYQAVAAQSERPIQTLRIQREPVAVGAKPAAAHQVGNMLVMSAPVVAKSAQTTAPPKVVKTLAAPKIDKGWAAVKDPAVQKSLRKQLAKQTKGLTTKQLAAKPVDPRLAHAVLPAATASKTSPSAPTAPATGKPLATPPSAPTHPLGKAGVTPAPVLKPHPTPAGTADERIAPKPLATIPEKPHATPAGAPVERKAPKPLAVPEKPRVTPTGPTTERKAAKPLPSVTEKPHVVPSAAAKRPPVERPQAVSVPRPAPAQPAAAPAHQAPKGGAAARENPDDKKKNQ